MKANDGIEKLMEEFDASPQSVGFHLRLQLADIIIDRLRKCGWTQRRLAEAAGLRSSFVSRVIHADANCTFDTAGKLLFALGLRAYLVAMASTADVLSGDDHAYQWKTGTQEDDGQEATFRIGLSTEAHRLRSAAAPA